MFGFVQGLFCFGLIYGSVFFDFDQVYNLLLLGEGGGLGIGYIVCVGDMLESVVCVMFGDVLLWYLFVEVNGFLGVV